MNFDLQNWQFYVFFLYYFCIAGFSNYLLKETKYQLQEHYHNSQRVIKVNISFSFYIAYIVNKVTKLSQIRYSLVVILELSGVLEVQYKEIMMSSINKNN